MGVVALEDNLDVSNEGGTTLEVGDVDGTALEVGDISRTALFGSDVGGTALEVGDVGRTALYVGYVGWTALEVGDVGGTSLKIDKFWRPAVLEGWQIAANNLLTRANEHFCHCKGQGQTSVYQMVMEEVILDSKMAV